MSARVAAWLLFGLACLGWAFAWEFHDAFYARSAKMNSLTDALAHYEMAHGSLPADIHCRYWLDKTCGWVGEEPLPFILNGQVCSHGAVKWPARGEGMGSYCLSSDEPCCDEMVPDAGHHH